MRQAILGIDIAKEKFDVTLTVNEQLSEGSFDNNEQGFDKLLRWLKKHRAGQVHACLEATGRYGDELALGGVGRQRTALPVFPTAPPQTERTSFQVLRFPVSLNSLFDRHEQYR